MNKIIIKRIKRNRQFTVIKNKIDKTKIMVKKYSELLKISYLIKEIKK